MSDNEWPPISPPIPHPIRRLPPRPVTTPPLHPSIAAGRWRTFSLAEQLGHVGSEVGRALRAKALGNVSRMKAALERTLELVDLTIADPKHQGRLKEVCRAREVVCDFFLGDNTYHSTAASLDRYFLQFATLAAARRSSPAPTH